MSSFTCGSEGSGEGERCGCGAPFGRCPFWQQAGKTAFGGWDEVDPGRVAALRSRVDRNRHIPALARRDLSRAGAGSWPSTPRYYARLYAAIAEVSGAELVIDSSKHPSLAHCLRWQDGVDLRVLHLVRDSRAVAYSWGRQVRRPDTDRESYMTRVLPGRRGGPVERAERRVPPAAAGVPVMRMRYEDFVAAPGAGGAPDRRLRRAAAAPAGYSLPGRGRGRRGWAELEPGHSVSGNPMRFTTGRVPIRRDERWRAGLPAAQRRAVTALTLPLLAGYGYLGGRA